MSQAQLAQGVRLQQVTSAQGGTPTVQVQRVTQVPQSQMTTVRQQLGLQQQVKQAAAQGTTLSIQQAGKPVTLIQSGASLLPGTKTVTATTAQLLQKQMLAQIVTSAAAAQQSTPTSSGVSVTQLARVIAPPATVQTVQVSQPQQTLTVESVALAAPVQQKQEEAKDAVPSLTTTLKPSGSQPVLAAQPQQAQVSITAQPVQQQQATPQLTRTVSAAQLQQAQAALRQQQQQQQAAEAQSGQGSSQRTSPYAMRLRKPSQTNN